MSNNWIGDLCYPDNPERRKEVNFFQNNVNILQKLIAANIKAYNATLLQVQQLASQNSVLQAIDYALPLTADKLRKFQDTPVLDTDVPVWRSVTSTLAGLGVQLGAVMLVQGIWAEAKSVAGAAGRFASSMADTAQAAEFAGIRGASSMVSSEMGAAASAGADVGAESAVEGAVAAVGEFGAIETAGAGLVLAGSVIAIIDILNAGTERTQLEQAIGKLEPLYRSMNADINKLSVKTQELGALETTLLDRYNKMRGVFLSLDAVPGETSSQTFTAASVSDAIASQTQLIGHFYSVLLTFQEFRQARALHSDFDSNIATYLPDLVLLGYAPSTVRAMQLYQAMCGIDRIAAAGAHA